MKCAAAAAAVAMKSLTAAGTWSCCDSCVRNLQLATLRHNFAVMLRQPGVSCTTKHSLKLHCIPPTVHADERKVQMHGHLWSCYGSAESMLDAACYAVR